MESLLMCVIFGLAIVIFLLIWEKKTQKSLEIEFRNRKKAKLLLVQAAEECLAFDATDSSLRIKQMQSAAKIRRSISEKMKKCNAAGFYEVIFTTTPR
jgi:hypothetical protein